MIWQRLQDNYMEGGLIMEITTNHICIIEDFENNRFKQVPKGTPYMGADVVASYMKLLEDNGFDKMEVGSIDGPRVSLREKDRRTLNGIEFAKIIQK